MTKKLGRPERLQPSHIYLKIFCFYTFPFKTTTEPTTELEENSGNGVTVNVKPKNPKKETLAMYWIIGIILSILMSLLFSVYCKQNR